MVHGRQWNMESALRSDSWSFECCVSAVRPMGISLGAFGFVPHISFYALEFRFLPSRTDFVPQVRGNARRAFHSRLGLVHDRLHAVLVVFLATHCCEGNEPGHACRCVFLPGLQIVAEDSPRQGGMACVLVFRIGAWSRIPN